MNNSQAWAVGMLLVTFEVYHAYLGSGPGTKTDPLVAGNVLMASVGLATRSTHSGKPLSSSFALSNVE